MRFVDSPVDSMIFEQREIYIKRDDLLSPHYSGNKARKFAYFLEHDFPQITKLIGYGSAQANSLYSLACLARLKGLQLDFYVDHIAEHLKQNPIGNYREALALGANIINFSELENTQNLAKEEYIKQKIVPKTDNALFIPEGGRCHYAEYGIFQLAKEILNWKIQKNIAKLTLFLPSGTGTTSLYLNKYFVVNEIDIDVFTCAVVGGDEYLKKQFLMLESDVGYHPQIITFHKKYHFGKLYAEFYKMWQQVSSGDITFELIYDPLGFLALQQYLKDNSSATTIMYIHQGGMLGNESMLLRYQRKYALKS